MDETVKSILLQSPMVAVLIYAVKTLYLDAKSERAAMIASIVALTKRFDVLIAVLISSPDKADELRALYKDVIESDKIN